MVIKALHKLQTKKYGNLGKNKSKVPQHFLLSELNNQLKFNVEVVLHWSYKSYYFTKLASIILTTPSVYDRKL